MLDLAAAAGSVVRIARGATHEPRGAHCREAPSTDVPTFDDPWWLSLIKVVGVFVLLVLLTLFTIWAERRVVGRMQNRIGPNRVGPQGLLQSLMDGIKLALKEQIFPRPPTSRSICLHRCWPQARPSSRSA